MKVFLFIGTVMFFGWALGQDEVNGAMVYNQNCVRCHNARPANEFSDREWDVVLPHMRVKAHLDGEESRAVVNFLQVSNSPEVLPGPKPASGGQELFSRYACVGCHIHGGKGGTIGPSLDNLFERRDDTFVKNKLANPRFNNPSSAMPKFPMGPEEIEALLAYLKPN